MKRSMLSLVKNHVWRSRVSIKSVVYIVIILFSMSTGRTAELFLITLYCVQFWVPSELSLYQLGLMRFCAARKDDVIGCKFPSEYLRLAFLSECLLLLASDFKSSTVGIEDIGSGIFINRHG